MTSLSRRSLLLAVLMAASFAAETAMAKDGDSGGGSGNSGSGSGNSGSGNGGSGGDDGDHEDDDRDDDSENDANGRRGGDHDRAIKAVRQGKAVSLKKLREHLTENYPGKILDVSLRRKSGDYYYNVRILAKGNRLKVLSLNALTLRQRGN